MSDQTVFEELDSVVIRFAGDSGDGMQMTGTQFTNTTAVFGNDISTMPDFPSEIRAPAGTLAGVSGFQVNIGSTDILTPGDSPLVLVAMNPAALKTSIDDLQSGGVIIANTDAFTKANLTKAGYDSNPLEDHSLDGYELHGVPLTTMNREALKDMEGLSKKDKDRCQNFFALGMTFWLFDRTLDTSAEWLKVKFAKKPIIAEANIKAMQTGYFFGETTEAFRHRYRIRKATLKAGTYRKITGNEATAIGLVTAAEKMGKTLFYGTYPITPATDILHNLAKLRNFGVRTFQAEDEIAAMGSVVGAAFGGAFAVTGTSGPGIALKSEAMNLGLMLELPMVIVNVQRGGPSTGLPTKVEQSDLLQVMYGRNGDSPMPVIAPATPSDCFHASIEAARMAMQAMTPVVVLSDGFLANSSEPWLLPDPDAIAPIVVTHPTEPNGEDGTFLPYKRDEHGARPWAIPGTKGLEHRLGGLDKSPETGNVSYVPEDHAQMTVERTEKIAKLVEMVPDQEVYGEESGDLLVISWGGTFGAVRSAVRNEIAEGRSVAHAHLRYLNPFPANLEELMGNYKKVMISELNNGQLALILRGTYGVELLSYTKIEGQPFKISEIAEHIEEALS